MEDLTGREFGPYRIIAPLGEGGMAAVYKAFHPGMERFVALKVLPQQLAAEPEFLRRFEQEARILAKLQHPHILAVFDYGETDGFTYIVMPFVESGTLDDVLKKRPLRLPKIRNVISQVGDALDYAHARGLVHRDIKPSNILLDERDNCLLTDFGISKILEGTARLTDTGSIVGTPAYMSPEQGRGQKVDGRSDIYSLGIVLYEMATGRVPYTAETPIAVIFKHIEDPLPLPREINPALPIAVENVILKAIAKQPHERFATAVEMVRALRAAIPETAAEGGTILPIPPADRPRSRPKPAPRKRWVYAVGGLILVLAVAAALVGLLTLTGELSPAGRATATETVAEVTATSIPIAIVQTWSPTAPWTRTSEPTDAAAPTGTSQPMPTDTSTLLASPTVEPDPPAATYSPVSPTPIPSPIPPTPTLPPTSTSTPIPPSPTPSCAPVTGVFGAVWSQVQDEIGCASGAAISGLVVEENFQGGKMFWREPIDYAQALVLFGNGTWRIFAHAPFVEGSPDYSCVDENTPAQTPPTPKRGFGLMWCDISDIRSGLGNAVDAERGYSGSMQSFDNGFMIRTDYDSTFIIYAAGAWEQR